jgi:hypothetical protein
LQGRASLFTVGGTKLPKKKETTVEDWIKPLEFNKRMLKRRFSEAAKEGKHLRPDEAMMELFDFWKKYLELDPMIDKDKRTYRRVDDIVLLRKIHHEAVDLYYETYFGKQEGATQLSVEYLEHILAMAEKGLTHREIAK